MTLFYKDRFLCNKYIYFADAWRAALAKHVALKQRKGKDFVFSLFYFIVFYTTQDTKFIVWCEGEERSIPLQVERKQRKHKDQLLLLWVSRRLAIFRLYIYIYTPVHTPVYTPYIYPYTHIYTHIYTRIYTRFQKGFHIERYIDRYILLFSCTCARVQFSFAIAQLVKKVVFNDKFFLRRVLCSNLKRTCRLSFL